MDEYIDKSIFCLFRVLIVDRGLNDRYLAFIIRKIYFF